LRRQKKKKMQFRFYTIPIAGDKTVEDELNAFVRSHKIVTRGQYLGVFCFGIFVVLLFLFVTKMAWRELKEYWITNTNRKYENNKSIPGFIRRVEI